MWLTWRCQRRTQCNQLCQHSCFYLVSCHPPVLLDHTLLIIISSARVVFWNFRPDAIAASFAWQKLKQYMAKCFVKSAHFCFRQCRVYRLIGLFKNMVFCVNYRHLNPFCKQYPHMLCCVAADERLLGEIIIINQKHFSHVFGPQY